MHSTKVKAEIGVLLSNMGSGTSQAKHTHPSFLESVPFEARLHAGTRLVRYTERHTSFFWANV